MRLRIHDPGHVALHRGIRTAIGVPASTMVGILTLGGSPGVVIACFGAVSLLSVADFPGSWAQRLRTSLVFGVLGALLVTIGLVAGVAIWSVVLATFIIGAVLSFVGLLHGSIAIGAPGLLMVYVVSATLDRPVEVLGDLMLGWVIALVVSILVSQLVFPRQPSTRIREALVSALEVAAGQVRVLAGGDAVDTPLLHRTLDGLHAAYLGDLARESGVDPRARAQMSLVTQAESLLSALTRAPARGSKPTGLTGSADVALAAATCIDQIARATAGDTDAEPTAQELADRWQQQWTLAVNSVRDAESGRHAILVVSAAFPDRAAAASVIRLVALSRQMLGLPPEDFPTGSDLHTLPVPPRHSARDDLRAQLSLSSPWLRSALRTGLGLALAVMVVSLLGLTHGFWVLLGVIAVLRLDTQSTLKSAGQALAGTIVGAAVGFAILVLDPSNPAALWVVFVALAFLATWTTVAVGFTVGQACFSAYVIVAFSVIDWPPQLVTALQRLENIGIGIGVSLLVAVLLWPHGVLRGVRRDVAEAIRAGTTMLSMGGRALVHGPGPSTDPQLVRTVSCILRSESMVDLALSHTDPQTARRHMEWKQVLDDVRTLLMAGHLLSLWAYDRPPIDRVLPELSAPMDADIAATVVAWDSVATRIVDQATPLPPQLRPHMIGAIGAVASSINRSTPLVADRLVAAAWTHGWLTLTQTAARDTYIPPPL